MSAVGELPLCAAGAAAPGTRPCSFAIAMDACDSVQCSALLSGDFLPYERPAEDIAKPGPTRAAAASAPARPLDRDLSAVEDPATAVAAAAAAGPGPGPPEDADHRRVAALLCAAVAAAAGAGRGPGPALTCAGCDALPACPVAAPCGHTLCGGARRCWPCPRCRPPGPGPPPALQPAVLLRAVLAAGWPRELRAQQLLQRADPASLRALVADTADANKHYQMSPLMLALHCHALHLLGCAKEALLAADALRQYAPAWSRGHYWRGCLLLMARRPQEAVASLLLAVALSAGQAPSNPPNMPCPQTLIEAGMLHINAVYGNHFQLLVNWVSREVIRIRRLETKTDHELVLVPESRPPILEEGDFDCVLCSRVLWKPITTPCGHTFCSSCLDRCLDYSAACPLCMAPLHELFSSPRFISGALETITRLFLPASSLCARELSARAELAAPAHVPVFVCTVAWPGVPCPLYVFEPRYRLLVRRCIEAGEHCFGMAAGTEGGHGFVDVGTILNVRDWLRLSDGCSLLTAVGARRFRVLSRAERDGYYTARVELLRDRPPGPGIRDLAEKVRSKGQRWVAEMPSAARSEVERAFGHMPESESEDWYAEPDGPAWPWWLLAILPLSPRLQVAILATTSLEKRLRAIDKTLDRIQHPVQTV